MKNIHSLTALRAIAAWWVVLYHFREHMFFDRGGTADVIASHGYLAVDFFFVLSGFIIARRYFIPRIDLAELTTFLRARFARIYPLHIFMSLLFTLNVAAFLLTGRPVPADRYDPIALALNLVLVHAWGFAHEPTWNVPSWSISAEWFAYLLYPISIGIALSRIRNASFAGVLMIVTALTLALIYSFSQASSLGASIVDLAVIRCLFQFVIGACISRMVGLTVAPGGAFSLLSMLAGLTLVSAAIVGVTPDYVTAPIGFGMIVLSASTDNPVSKWVGILKPVTYLGTISYSTYMIHYFVRDWTKFLVVTSESASIWPVVTYLVCTLVGSIMLFHYVEQPARKAISGAGRYRPALEQTTSQ
jgi:peptidoglycan/LPS O-acetylase OafA/YrhL